MSLDPVVHRWTDAVLARVDDFLKVCCFDLVGFDHHVDSDCNLGVCCLDLVGFDHPVNGYIERPVNAYIEQPLS